MLSVNIMLMSGIVSGVIGALIGLVVAVPSTYLIVRFIQKNNASKDAAQAKSLLEEAKAEAKNMKKEAVLEAKEETLRLTSECEQEIKARRAEIQKSENRISQREEFLDKKEESLEKKNELLEKAKLDLVDKENELLNRVEEQNKIYEKMTAELERISKLSREDAKKELIAKYEDEAKKDALERVMREVERCENQVKKEEEAAQAQQAS